MKKLFSKNYWAMKGLVLLVLVIMGGRGDVLGQATLPITGAATTPSSSTMPTGFSQVGLGTAYNSSTTPWKFDTQGDYVILNFTGTPGTLTYNLSNNTLTGSYAFDVLVSDNGSTYTTLISHTAITSGSFSSSLTSSTRYVKWIYTTKGSGNVGLGSINLTAASSLTPPTLTAAISPTVDADFDVTFTDDAAWSGGGGHVVTVGGTTLTTGYTLSSGKITFSPSSSNPVGLLQTAGVNKAIVISKTGYNNATVSQTINVGAANKLGITTQPTAPLSNGSGLAVQPVVKIQDQYGNTITTDNSTIVTAAVSAGSWTIGGTLAKTAVNGIATFTDVTATSIGAIASASIGFTSNPNYTTAISTPTFSIPAPSIDYLNIASLGTAVIESFDGMSTSATANLPQGFKVSDQTSSPDFSTGKIATTLAYGNTGTGVVTGTSSGGIINWANGATAVATDRSLGFLTTTSGFISPNSIILKIYNNTSTSINSLDISFDYEKYRSGTRQCDWTFFHGSSTNPTTSAIDGDQSYIADGVNTLIYNPEYTNSKNVSVTGLNISIGGTYYLKWTYTGLAGSSNSQGIGIDNLSITAKVSSTITATGTTSYSYLGTAQGPSTASVTGSGGAISYSYVGVSGTSYGPSATKPTNVGSYTVTATVEADNSYSAATSAALGFTIEAITNNWTGTTSNSWNTAGNWSLTRVPSSLNDNITITSGSPIMNVNYTLASGRTLTVSGNTTLIVSTGKTLTIANGATLTLKSDANGTASIGNSAGTITGNITVERYIPANRKYRFLAAPVVGATAAQWRDNSGTTPGIGTHITGGSVGSNFDQSTLNAPSAFWYNEVNAGNLTDVGSGATSDPGWTAFTNGNTQDLTNGKGFRIFVRGDRTLSLTGSIPTANNTTLSVTGTYPANSVSIATTKTNSNTNSGFNLVGNPYPATIDWNTVTKGTGITNTYSTFNPSSNSYVEWNGSTGDATQYIASGQAFFVQQTGATGGITIAEANKVSNTAGNFFRNKLTDHLKVSMKYDSANYDAAFIHFREDALNEFDNYDGLKFQNAGVNIASVGSDGKRYNINSLASLTETTEIPLSVLGSALTNFELKFEDVESFKNHELYLIDHYLNKMLLLSDGFTYPIALSSDSASVKDGRFKIVFVQKATGINPNEKISNAFILYPNPAANTIHLLLDVKNTNNENVSFEIFNQLGARMQQGNLDFTTAKDQAIAIDNLAKGSYFIKLQSISNHQTIKFIK